MSILEIVVVYVVNTFAVMYMIWGVRDKGGDIDWNIVTACLIFTVPGVIIIRGIKILFKAI